MSSASGQWQVVIHRSAKRTLRRLPQDIVSRISRAIDRLAQDPHAQGSTKLTGYDLYRIRVSDWRIIYAIEDDKLIVLVLEVGPRGQVYRDL
jgi:mRNA interferase RelE/StbE